MADDHACRRTDHVSAAYVDAALAIARIASVTRAELMLLRYGLPMRVIARVLHQNGLHHRKYSTILGITEFKKYGQTLSHGLNDGML